MALFSFYPIFTMDFHFRSRKDFACHISFWTKSEENLSPGRKSRNGLWLPHIKIFQIKRLLTAEMTKQIEDLPQLPQARRDSLYVPPSPTKGSAKWEHIDRVPHSWVCVRRPRFLWAALIFKPRQMDVTLKNSWISHHLEPSTLCCVRGGGWSSVRASMHLWSFTETEQEVLNYIGIALNCVGVAWEWRGPLSPGRME